MLGAIIGDIVGSRFEWNNYRAKDFEFFTYKCFPTDDSIMSLGVAKAILESKADHSDLSNNAIKYMREVGQLYPDCGYGGGFRKWMYSDNPQPYNSYGNGAAMRVSACGFVAKDIEHAKILSNMVTRVTHNHPEGLKGAEATAVAIWLARDGKNILEIRDYIDKHYYPMDFTLDGIRATYQFNETCQDTVPQALMAFFESNSFEDAIRNAISIGGDSDTLAAITGGVAEAYYGIPADIRKHALTFLDERLLGILVDFENKYPSKIEKVKDDVSVSVKAPTKVKNGDRGTMMESAVKAVNKDLKDSESESEETTSEMLFRHLFGCCDILRGPINQDEYKSYVTPILFFKRVSDVYDEETQDALEASGGDEEFASFPENHRFEIPEGCHWNDVREANKNIGTAIVKAMTGIERANPDTLNGVFSSFDDANWTDKGKLSDERLKDLVEHMSKIKVGNKNYSDDIMGDSYEYLIKKFADLSKKNAGEFYTPRAIVQLLVRILNPQPGETVYDPACGTGGMLIEAIHRMNYDVSTYGKIYGQEKNLATSAIARMNLFLHGARDFNIIQGDTLKAPYFLYRGMLKTFDCVIANPPFSLKNWGAGVFESDLYGRNIWGSPTDSSADFAWLQHMVMSMDKDKGRCAVILPQGVLFHSGKDGEMRKKLVESDKLEAVITFVSGVFYSTSVSACALILNNAKKPERVGQVCLIDGSEIYTPQRAQNILTDANVDEIYDLYKNYDDVLEKSKKVSIADIKARDYILSVNTYIERKEQEVVSPEEVRKQFMAAVEDVKRSEDKLIQLLKEGGYIDE
ncbi:MAG: N-6 DNA methylase [Lachnospiraceae bacterium]|nr:N-6 DNA methylase [Lachnospiraceae bacterium]